MPGERLVYWGALVLESKAVVWLEIAGAAAQPVAGRACSLRKRGSPLIPVASSLWLRNGPQDRRLDQDRWGRCAAHRRQSLLATKAGFTLIPVASSLWLRNGPQDRPLDQDRWGRCAARRRQSLLATKSGFSAISVASSLWLRNGPQDRPLAQDRWGCGKLPVGLLAVLSHLDQSNR